ncbi:envelope stress response membrane protein PspB [Spirabiliibacterium falconis]|uniref:envelope stress response membrane protein PspB n=1 Tax=Spirabiliibacterium falconis TaxID=572023 RepID=UPI001AACFA00|nr:envelope stress response membrane protein PspB [Spirabiliibacterium falconis]MBE2893775.1 envelope stress response membrane protein PspB [Spirabiliibacterium falconis]
MIFNILALSVIAFIGCLMVLPLWLYRHYKGKQHINLGVSQEDLNQLTALQRECKALRTRVENLEALLDYHQPHWRETQ